MDIGKIQDKELVARCLAHDRNAQRCLFESYCNHMYSIAYRILGDADLADDVLQETFIDVFNSLNSFRFESTLYTWIKSITVRKSVREIRRLNKNESLDQHPDITYEQFNDDFSGEDLDQAIQSLPAGARTVFLLAEVEAYKHQEISAMLGISTGTVKSQLHYAKQLLKQKLRDVKKS